MIEKLKPVSPKRIAWFATWGGVDKVNEKNQELTAIDKAV